MQIVQVSSLYISYPLNIFCTSTTNPKCIAEVSMVIDYTMQIFGLENIDKF